MRRSENDGYVEVGSAQPLRGRAGSVAADSNLIGSVNPHLLPNEPISQNGNPDHAPSAINHSQRNAKIPSKRRLACRGCRQAKFRCDLSSSASGPCKRCVKRREECQVDAEYKRVSKKHKIAQLEEEIQHLHSVVANSQDQPQDNTNVELPDQTIQNTNSDLYQEANPTQSCTFNLSRQPSSPTTASAWREQDARHRSSLATFTTSATPHSIPSDHYASTISDLDAIPFPRRLGELSVGGVDVKILFRLFFQRFHPFLGILDPSLTPDQYYDRSELLFWAIISVACRHHKEDPKLITSLAAPVTSLLWKKISTFPHTNDLVQAVLLISTWPFPVSTMNTDPSLTLLSIAKAAALTLGLHRPETAQDFLRFNTQLSAEEIQEAVKIWAGCYIASQNITVAVGQPPLFAADWAIDRACQTESVYELPRNLHHALLIQQFSNNISNTMSVNRQNATGLPPENEIGMTLAYLERGYGDLQNQLGDVLTTENEITLCSVGLQLRAFYFFETSSDRQRGLLKSYSTALALISLTQSAMEKYGFMLCSPVHFGHSVLNAGIIILKILHSSVSTMVDYTGGKRAFNSAVTLLQQSSIEENDLPGRSSKILTQLWAIHDALALKGGLWQEPSLRLRSRSSASVMHDALWFWRDTFDKRSGPHPRGTDLPSSFANGSAELTTTGFTPSTAPEHTTAAQAANPEDPLSGLNFDIQDMTAIWDISIPPFIPMVLDS